MWFSHTVEYYSAMKSNEMLFFKKRGSTDAITQMNLGNLIVDEPWKPYSKGKAPVTTGHTAHDSVYLERQHRQIHRDRKPIRGCQGDREGEVKE